MEEPKLQKGRTMIKRRAKSRKTSRKKVVRKKQTTTKRRKVARKATRKKATRKKATRKKATKKKAVHRKKKTSLKRRTAKKTKTKSKRRKSGLSTLKYSLSESLASIVGSSSATRPHVMKGVWAYIKKHKLQDTKNRRMIKPDQKLATVIGSKPMDMLKLAGALSKHIK